MFTMKHLKRSTLSLASICWTTSSSASSLFIRSLTTSSSSSGTAQTLPLDVKGFVSQDFIQDAIANPGRPESVLSFFFGVNYYDPTQSYKNDLRNGQIIINRMSRLWFQGDPEYDTLCQSFSDIIRQVGKRQQLPSSWDDSRTTTTTTNTIDNQMAQILLCDQLSRNAFRGTQEAFAYDEVAFDIANQLVTDVITSCNNNDGTDQQQQYELYPPYYSFLVLPLMHSESIASHEMAIQLINDAKQKVPQMTSYFNYQLETALDHRRVIDRFGRYPHRNKIKGRTSTPEELEYLADITNLPAWASSQ